MNTNLLHTIAQNEQVQRIYHEIHTNHPEEEQILTHFLQKNSAFYDILPDFIMAFDTVITGFTAKQRLFLCGNGGSFADAMHISGELLKSFKKKRTLSEADKKHFATLECGEILAEHLEYGLPSLVLGLNHSLFSAVQNDNKVSALQYAQELYALGQKDDILLAISTSGNAQNVLYAVSTAKALGMKTIGLTGKDGGKLARAVDIAIKAPESSTESIQELHIPIYHTLCAMLESRFFS